MDKSITNIYITSITLLSKTCEYLTYKSCRLKGWLFECAYGRRRVMIDTDYGEPYK